MMILSKEFNVSVSEIMSNSKEDRIVKVRFMAWLVLSKQYKMPNSIIAEFYNKDRSTIYNGVKKAEKLGLVKFIPKELLSTYPPR